VLEAAEGKNYYICRRQGRPQNCALYLLAGGTCKLDRKSRSHKKVSSPLEEGQAEGKVEVPLPRNQKKKSTAGKETRKGASRGKGTRPSFVFRRANKINLKLK